MSKVEIIVSLFTIVYGLMLSVLFTNIHKLIRGRKKVKWHWLPLLSSWYLFMLILKNWWSMAISDNNLKEYNILHFLAYAHVMVLLYLSVSVVLPDKIQKQGIDLKEYYFKHHRYYWGLMTGVGLLAMLIRIVPKLINSSALNISNIVVFLIATALTILLIISKRYWIHAVLLISFTLIVLFEILSRI